LKRLLFACAALAAGSFPAFAQYYPAYPPPGSTGYITPRPYYGERPYYAPPPVYRPRPRRQWDDGAYGGYYAPPRVAYGNVCITSRGNCRTPPLPDQSPCRCNIPGFGLKRGNVLAGW
jgi:hypothetical protein